MRLVSYCILSERAKSGNRQSLLVKERISTNQYGKSYDSYDSNDDDFGRCLHCNRFPEIVDDTDRCPRYIEISLSERRQDKLENNTKGQDPLKMQILSVDYPEEIFKQSIHVLKQKIQNNADKYIVNDDNIIKPSGHNAQRQKESNMRSKKERSHNSKNPLQG